MKLYISKSEPAEKNVVVDDMILTTDMPTSAGSKMLDGYMSLFEAEAVTRLNKNNYKVFAKSNTGEMNIDLLGETSYYGVCTDEKNNVVNAMAQSIKNKEAMAGVTLEVNGAAARAAAISNLTFVKPTYGTVSRFGTIASACSGETVSVMAENVKVCKEILSTISGHDNKDGTSLPQEKCESAKEVNTIKKIAVAKSLLKSVNEEVKENFDKVIAKLKENGIEVVEIDADELLLAKPAWNILMSAEVCNNVSRYDGVKYGYRTKDYTTIDELYTNSRTEAFGYLLKSTILFGSETLSEANYMKVYDKAMRIRRVISEYLNSTFGKFDAILAPVSSKMSYSLDEVKENKYIAYDESIYTAPASISGMPVVVTNGVQFIGKALSEGSLLALAETL